MRDVKNLWGIFKGKIYVLKKLVKNLRITSQDDLSGSSLNIHQKINKGGIMKD